MKKVAAAALAALALLLLDAPPAAGAAWRWPLPGDVITPYRNGGDPYAGGQHRGIDIAGRVGDPVVAAVGGVVQFAGTAGASGLAVTVRTNDGRYDTSYLHFDSIAVKEGEGVSAGDRLGAVGTSGRRSAERPHLHFGVRDAGTRHGYHDPLGFLPSPPGGSPDRPPAGVPVDAPGRPSPVPARPPRPVAVPQQRPVRAPAGRRVPAPGRAPREVPARRPHGLPALHPVPVEAARSSPAHAPGPRRVAEPHLGAAPDAEPATAPAPGDRRSPRGVPAHDGPDLGWALACLGLLVAAALIGRSEDGRNAASRGRAQLSALLRPLFGRG
jgi:peptidase M23-like protein